MPFKFNPLSGQLDLVRSAPTTDDVAYSPQLNSPTHLTELSSYIMHYGSSSILTGGAFSDNGNGTCTIATGELLVRDAASVHTGDLVSTPFTGATITPTNDATTYIYVSYNSGSPIVTSGSILPDGLNNAIMYVVERHNNELNHIDARSQALDYANKDAIRLIDTGPLRHATGAAVSSPSLLYLKSTEGKLYYGVNLISPPEFNTSVAGTANVNVFRYYYHVASAWTESQDNKSIDNTQYDNGTGLTALSPNKYKVDWIYLIANSPSRLAVVYGSTEHNKLADAQAEAPPSVLPPALTSPIAILIGRAISRQGVGTLISVDSVFTTTFTTTVPTDINSLSGTPLTVVNGGTNSTTQQDAINTLAGAVTSTYYLRGNGTNVVMAAIQAGDVPTLNQNTSGTAANLSGTPALPNGTTATTQSALDNSTKLATTAYTDSAIATKSKDYTQSFLFMGA